MKPKLVFGLETPRIQEQLEGQGFRMNLDPYKRQQIQEAIEAVRRLKREGFIVFVAVTVIVTSGSVRNYLQSLFEIYRGLYYDFRDAWG